MSTHVTWPYRPPGPYFHEILPPVHRNRRMDLRIGFDLHGVLDAKPEQYQYLLYQLVARGVEVHILTGALEELARRQLMEAGFFQDRHFTHFMSISQYAIDNKLAEVTYDHRGSPWMDPVVWNRIKGEYCEKVGIHFHLDDTPEYAEHFKSCLFAVTGKAINPS